MKKRVKVKKPVQQISIQKPEQTVSQKEQTPDLGIYVAETIETADKFG